MSSFTANALSSLFEEKGYTGLTWFYSTSFEFTDTIKAGMERVQREFAQQDGAGTFSLSSYPVWEQQGDPYVSSYFSCSYKDDNITIRLADLSYNNGAYHGELCRKLLKGPAPGDIPDSQHLRDTLKHLTGITANEVKERHTKKFKL